MLGSSRLVAFVLVAPLVAAHVSPAAADTSPWAVGVSEEQKAKAKVLLDAGNALLLEKKYVEALEQYTAAVTVWDHPAIRFNMVRCQIQLGRNLEAHANLERALRYGAAALEDTVYNEALAYQKLLATQVGDIAVSCTQPGVKLTLDGKPLASCPARETRRVLAGPHQIVGEAKGGLLPKTVELVVVGGKPTQVDITLEPLEAGAVIVHRWHQAVPWTVFGSGFVVAGAGSMLLLWSRAQMRTFDQFVDGNCASNCTAEELAPVAGDKSSAEFKSTLGVGFVITGGAAVATGAVMIWLNRGRKVYPEVRPLAEGGAAVSWSTSF